MPISTVSHAGAGNAADQTSYSSASVSPTPGSLVLVAVFSACASFPNVPTVSGCGVAWTMRESSGVQSGSAIRVSVFSARGPFVPGALTFDFAGQTQTSCGWSIVEFPGARVRFPFNTAEEGSIGTGTTTQTLAAFESAQSAFFMATCHSSTESVTPGTGFTELHDFAAATTLRCHSQWKVNDTTGQASGWSSALFATVSFELAEDLGRVGIPMFSDNG